MRNESQHVLCVGLAPKPVGQSSNLVDHREIHVGSWSRRGICLIQNGRNCLDSGCGFFRGSCTFSSDFFELTCGFFHLIKTTFHSYTNDAASLMAAKGQTEVNKMLHGEETSKSASSLYHFTRIFDAVLHSKLTHAVALKCQCERLIKAAAASELLLAVSRNISIIFSNFKNT
jgi:hypothetical protein